ncbi:MAG TPA: hypothetical protein VFD60_07045 [Nitrososphaeraceae archaeon]|nr:hypothetical protein [Nitrososphaeraceae archaeon]
MLIINKLLLLFGKLKALGTIREKKKGVRNISSKQQPEQKKYKLEIRD